MDTFTVIYLTVACGIALLVAAIFAIITRFIARNRTAVILVGFSVFALALAGLLVFVPPPDF